MKRPIVVFGGDGFCGWPTSLHLSQAGYDVIIVDNLSRRKIDVELECESLTPIQPISKRIDSWQKITERESRSETSIWPLNTIGFSVCLKKSSREQLSILPNNARRPTL